MLINLFLPPLWSTPIFFQFTVLFCSFNLMTWQLQTLLSIYIYGYGAILYIYLRIWCHTLDHGNSTRSYICEETLLYSEDICQLILLPQLGEGLMYPCLFHTRRLAALILFRHSEPSWVHKCSRTVISRGRSLIQSTILSRPFSFSVPLLWWLLSLEDGCDINIVHVTDYSTVICSLNFV